MSKFLMLSLTVIVLIFAPVMALSAQESLSCEPGFRVVEHNLGEICIPENPQRIAAVDLDVVALMRLLDIKPVAHVQEWYESWLASTPEWTGGEAFIEGSIDVGFPANVESLLRSQPDLIITNDPENYDQLNAIAPTILFDIYATDSTDWADFSRYMGTILNVEDEVEALIDQTNARIEILTESLQSAGSSPVVSVINYSDFGIIYGAPYFVYNQVMSQAQIARPAGQDIDNEQYDAENETYWVSLSEEQLPLIDGDVLVMMISQTPETLEFVAPLLADIGADPLWGSLNAVQTDEFYTVPYQRWISFDPYSVNRIVDDLFYILLGDDAPAEAVNPFVPVAVEPSTDD